MSHEKLHQEAIRWYRQGLDELTPGEAFTQREAESALAAAEHILHHVRQWLQVP